MGELAVKSLWRILPGKAAGTLRRHLPGLKLWLDFTHGSEILTANTEVSTLVSFLSCVQLKKRVSNAPVVSLKFVAGILGWDRLSACLANPVVTAWTGSTEAKEARKEALPWPLATVANFEKSVLEAMSKEEDLDGESCLIVLLLIMRWAALRFSDAQRVSVAEMDIVQGIVGCNCWRTKSSREPMPWGCLTVGIHGDWTRAVVIARQKKH